jgi:3-oxoacyl-[acyl-carrier-protein] synthase-3
MIKKHSVSIKGIGSYAPSRVLTNKDMSELYGTNEQWPEIYLGIKERHWVVDELTSDIGYKAALKALEDANISAKDVDLLILATSSPDKIAPSTACIIAEKLQINCPCFDINAVCTGFLYALNIASSLISSGAYKNILLIAAETYSRITDTNNRDCVYFGDGSGAIVLSSSNNGWIGSKIYSDPTGKDGFMTPINSTFIMNGKAVFEAGSTNLPIAIKEVWSSLNVNIHDVKYLVPHQPSIKMLQSIANSVGIPFEKVVTIMDKYANIAAASIPMALDTIVKQGKVNNGDILTLASVGSGWTWGAGVIKWDK